MFKSSSGTDHSSSSSTNHNNQQKFSQSLSSPNEMERNSRMISDNIYNRYANSYGNDKLKNPLFTSYPGKNNFTTSASFKSPSVWNCDWNLNNIPEMHLKYASLNELVSLIFKF